MKCTLEEIGITTDAEFKVAALHHFDRPPTRPTCGPHDEWHWLVQRINATLHARFKESAAAGQLTHVILGVWPLAELTDGQTLQTVDGQTLTVVLLDNGRLQFCTADGAVLVVSAEVCADDGVAYVIDAVHAARTPVVGRHRTKQKKDTLARTLEASPDLPDSAKSAVAIKLAAQSDPATRFTVLAPSHSALRTMPAGMMDALVAQSPAAAVMQVKQLSRWQVLTAFQLMQKPGLIASWDVGMGKTLLAVLAALLLICEGLVERAVFVVPKSVKRNFEDTLEEVGAADLLREMDPEAKLQTYMHVCTIDEIAIAYPDLMSPNMAEREAERLRAKDRFGAALVVVDEAHSVARTLPKSNSTDGCHKGCQTAMMMMLSRLAARRLLMTATPVPNSPADLLTLAVIAQGGSRIVKTKELATCVQVPGVKTPLLDEKERTKRLQAIFGDTITFLRRAPEPSEQRAWSFVKPASSKAKTPSASAYVNSQHMDMSEFPSVEHKDMTICMTPEEAAEYRAGIAEMQAKASARAAEQGSGRFAVDAFHHQKRGQSNLTGGKKAQAVRQAIQATQDHRFLVYSNFKEWGCELVQQEFDKHDITYVIITGQTSKEDRDKAVYALNSGKVQGIILSPAGGEGLDLKGIRHVFILDPAWNTATFNQSVGRAVRRGSHNEYALADRTVTVHRLSVTFPEGDGERTGDDVVQSIRDDKMPLISSFLRRLLEACDPLRTDEDD